MRLVATHYFDLDDYQHFEKIWETGPDSFRLQGHSAHPKKGPYGDEMTPGEFLRWAVEHQATLIPQPMSADETRTMPER